jgi:hypothetical protein
MRDPSGESSEESSELVVGEDGGVVERGLEKDSCEDNSDGIEEVEVGWVLLLDVIVDVEGWI